MKMKVHVCMCPHTDGNSQLTAHQWKCLGAYQLKWAGLAEVGVFFNVAPPSNPLLKIMCTGPHRLL